MLERFLVVMRPKVLDQFGNQNGLERTTDFRKCSGSALGGVLGGPLWIRGFQGGEARSARICPDRG